MQDEALSQALAAGMPPPVMDYDDLELQVKVKPLSLTWLLPECFFFFNFFYNSQRKGPRQLPRNTIPCHGKQNGCESHPELIISNVNSDFL